MTTANKPGSVVRNGLWVLLETLVPALVPLVVTPLVVRGLGASHYGLVLLVISVASLGALSEMGLSVVGARELAVGRARGDAAYVRDVMATLGAAYLGLGVLASVLVWLLAPWLADDVFALGPDVRVQGTAALRWAGVWTAAQLFQGYLGGFFRAAERFDVTARAALVSTVIGQGLAVASARAHWLPGVLAASLGAILLQCVWLSWLAIRSERAWIAWQGPSSVLLRRLLGASVFQFVAAGFYRLGEQAPRILLTRVAGTAGLAHFSVPFGLVQQLQVFVAAPAQLLLPRIAACHAQGDTAAVHDLLRRAQKLVLWVGLAGFLPLALVAGPLLGRWMGADFSENGALHMTLLCLAGVAGALRMVYAYVLYGLGDTRTVMWAEILRALVQVALLVLAVRVLGAWGASLAWLASWASLYWVRRATDAHVAAPRLQGLWPVFAATVAIALPLGLVARAAAVQVPLHGLPGALAVLALSGLATAGTLLATLGWGRPFAEDAAPIREVALGRLGAVVARLKRLVSR